MATTNPTRLPKVSELEQFVRETLASEVAVKRLLVEQYLFLEVRARTQSASWVFRYSYGGKKASAGFGRFPGVGLAEARRKAENARVLLTQGVNPVASKRANIATAKLHQQRTVAAAVSEWLASHTKRLTSDKYALQKRARLDDVLNYTKLDTKTTHAVSALGLMPVAKVTTENVTDSLGVLTNRGAHETARRVLGDLTKAFDWARGKGWRAEANPATGVSVILEKPQKKGHRAPEIAELGDIAGALQEAVQNSSIDYYDSRLGLLLLLTGARTGEIRLARWGEVFDLEGEEPRIEIPAERMKKRKEWTITLSKQAVKLLRDMRTNAEKQGVPNEQIFWKYPEPGKRRKGLVCNENAVNGLLVKVGLHDKIVGHGFRKLFSTAAHSSWPYAGLNREKAIELALAHVNTSTVEHVYNKSQYLGERSQLTQWWADCLDHSARGARSGNVIDFRRPAASP